LENIFIYFYFIIINYKKIETGKKFAAKVINKEFMAGKEMFFINELNILKKVSMAHPNLVTLHSYFETPLNCMYKYKIIIIIMKINK